MTAKELREKYEADLATMQESCEHGNLSEFVDHYWAPGHRSLTRVKYCLHCEKIVEKEHPDQCPICGFYGCNINNHKTP